MAVILRPIVGHTTAHTTRLWCYREAGERVSGVRLRGDSGSPMLFDASPTPTATGVAWLAEVSGLLADSAYRFEFVDADRRALPRADGAFRTLAEHGDLRMLSFLVASCHKVGGHDTDLDAWKKLARRLQRGPTPAFLLMCGDQAYCDDARVTGWREHSPAQLDAAFERCYLEAWKHPEVQDVWSRLPTYMMWDDHEIMDDWGSGGHTRERPDLARLYAAADRAYLRFQQAHNPPVPAGVKDYGFRAGPAGFYVLDLRSQRGVEPASPVLGAAQLARLDAWLAGEGQAVNVLFVVSPVPLAHVSSFLVEVTRALGDEVPLDFDTACQWTFEENRRDLEALLDRLFVWQNQAAMRQVVVLSGDVHMPTLGTIHSRVHARRKRIFQFTASAISNSVWHPMMHPAISRLLGAVDVRRSIDLVPDKYRSTNQFIGVHRNFGEVELASDLQGGFTLRFDLQEEAGPSRVLERLSLRPV